MKKAIVLLMCIGVGLLVMGLPVKESEGATKILIKAVTAWPINHVGNDNYKEFIKRVNERSKGELEIKLLGGPEVIPAFDQLKALSTGAVDMSHGAKSYYAGTVPEGIIPELASFQFEIEAIRGSGILEMYTRAHLERAKIFYLGMSQIGTQCYIMTRKPISNLEDLKGVKLRSMGGTDDVILGELGISLVKIQSPDVYEALQRGIVDGTVRPPISLFQYKEYEMVKYVISPSFYYATGGVYLGEKIWNTIPEHLQKLMKEVIIETEIEAHKYFDNMNSARLKEAQEKYGIKVIYLSDKDAAKFVEIRRGAKVKDWILKKAPDLGPPIYEKVLPYIK